MEGGDGSSWASPAPGNGCLDAVSPDPAKELPSGRGTSFVAQPDRGEAMTETRRLIVTGLVQGVGFRYAMAAQARLLGVSGWVRNRRDGSVEAMIAGSAGQIEEMLAWSRVGPAGAAVDQVIVETGCGEYSGFEFRPTA